MKVSIIVPVYNTEDYLHRCITSLLQQDFREIEVILVNDGSTDNSSRILNFYQQQDSRVITINKCNQGQGPSRNLGIQIARGEYIYFVDSDDYLEPNTIGLLYGAATENSLDICSPYIPDHYFNYDLDLLPCLPNKAQFIKREIVSKYQILQPNTRSGQDGVFSHLVITHCQRIGMLKDAKYNYTHARDGSTFQSYLNKSHLVPEIVNSHYEAIERHYDTWGLWRDNADRLLLFINNETLRNRYYPHKDNLSDEQKREIFATLSTVAKRAYVHASKELKLKLTLDLKSICDGDTDSFVHKSGETCSEILISPKSTFKRNNDFIICKRSRQIKVSSDSEEIATKVNSDIFSLQNEVKLISQKLDYVLNTSNNNTAAIISNQFKNDFHLEKQHGIIASLTTIKSRISIVHTAIESIFSQTEKPEQIILWISDDFNLKSHLTDKLKSLIKHGLEIRQVKDIGPHTKLIYALKEFPNHSIITFDDDIIYPNNTISTLLSHSKAHPECIIANWARELCFDNTGVVRGVRHGKLLTPPRLENNVEVGAPNGAPSLLAFAYGTSGVLYPPNAFDDRVFDIAALKRFCPKEDDIWFKAMSLLKGTRVVPTNLGINPVHHTVKGSQIEALRHFNHTEGNNAQQMQNVFNAYNLYKILN